MNKLYWVEYIGDKQRFDGGIEISIEVSAQHVPAATEAEAIEKTIDLVKGMVGVMLLPMDFSADEESDDDEEEDDLDLDEGFDEEEDEDL